MYKLLTLVSIASLLFFTECKKYPSGPAFSLRSKAERVANTWKVEKLLISNVDSTTFYTNLLKDYTVTLTKNGSYVISYFVTVPIFGNISNTESGTWAFTNNKNDILITPSSLTIGTLPKPSTQKILKLKEKEFWVENKDSNGKVTETHYIPK